MHETETVWSETLELLRQRGWRQGSGGETGPMCVGQALVVASLEGRPQQYVSSVHYAYNLIDHIGHDRPDPPLKGDSALSQRVWTIIVGWNDKPGRTFAEVEDVLTELHERTLAEGGLIHV